MWTRWSFIFHTETHIFKSYSDWLEFSEGWPSNEQNILWGELATLSNSFARFNWECHGSPGLRITVRELLPSEKVISNMSAADWRFVAPYDMIQVTIFCVSYCSMPHITSDINKGEDHVWSKDNALYIWPLFDSSSFLMMLVGLKPNMSFWTNAIFWLSTWYALFQRSFCQLIKSSIEPSFHSLNCSTWLEIRVCCWYCIAISFWWHIFNIYFWLSKEIS